MAKKIKNYKNLTDEMLSVFQQVKQETISLDKANTLVKISNAVVRTQVAKIISTRVTAENNIKFFKDQ